MQKKKEDTIKSPDNLCINSRANNKCLAIHYSEIAAKISIEHNQQPQLSTSDHQDLETVYEEVQTPFIEY